VFIADLNCPYITKAQAMSKVTHTDQHEDQDRLHSRRTFLVGTGFIAGGFTLSSTRIAAASGPDQPPAPKPPDPAAPVFDFTGITMLHLA
jgi:hypothetical protein